MYARRREDLIDWKWQEEEYVKQRTGKQKCTELRIKVQDKYEEKIQ